MKKRIYVLRANSSKEYINGVYYFTYFIVFPGHKHAYNYTMSEEGWFFMKENLLPDTDTEIKELPWSEDKNLWTMIKEHEAARAQTDFQSA